MSFHMTPSRPRLHGYDVVIVGGATSGSSIAWHLSTMPGFDGRVLVIERDITLHRSATAASNNCMRQQFATEINVRISQYAAQFVTNFRQILGGDPAVPELGIRNFGYLYLADCPKFADTLRQDQQLQVASGAGTQILTTTQIAERFGFYYLDDIVAGSFNDVDEGAFDAPAMVEWMRRKAIENGVEFIENEVVAVEVNGTLATHVTLATGESLSVGSVVNAAGTRADQLAQMAGTRVPIEARRRYTFVFSAEHPLEVDLPLTIDPSGVHLRSYGPKDYLVGSPPIGADMAVDPDDFSYSEPIWQARMHPIVTHRVPALGALTVTDSWMGHYEYNTFDQNAIVGADSDIANLYSCIGFSGHGSQQAPACGRAIAELITYREFRTLDLSALGHDRITRNQPLVERAVI